MLTNASNASFTPVRQHEHMSTCPSELHNVLRGAAAAAKKLTGLNRTDMIESAPQVKLLTGSDRS